MAPQGYNFIPGAGQNGMGKYELNNALIFLKE